MISTRFDPAAEIASFLLASELSQQEGSQQCLETNFSPTMTVALAMRCNCTAWELNFWENCPKLHVPWNGNWNVRCEAFCESKLCCQRGAARRRSYRTTDCE